MVLDWRRVSRQYGNSRQPERPYASCTKNERITSIWYRIHVEAQYEHSVLHSRYYCACASYSHRQSYTACSIINLVRYELSLLFCLLVLHTGQYPVVTGRINKMANRLKNVKINMLCLYLHILVGLIIFIDDFNNYWYSNCYSFVIFDNSWKVLFNRFFCTFFPTKFYYRSV